eukprot:2022149-Amphidinium_carterae.1
MQQYFRKRKSKTEPYEQVWVGWCWDGRISAGGHTGSHPLDAVHNISSCAVSGRWCLKEYRTRATTRWYGDLNQAYNKPNHNYCIDNSRSNKNRNCNN